jgi:hypothetical protein
VSATDAKLALDVVRRTGDDELEGRLMAAFGQTNGLPLLHRYVIGPDGEPIGMGPPIDVVVGKNVPDGFTISVEGRTWSPSRAGGRGGSSGKRGRPRSEYLPPREAEESLVRAWERIWLYVRERVLGMPPGRTAFQGLDSQSVQLSIVPPGTTSSVPPSWFAMRTVEVGTDPRDRRQVLRELLAEAPTSEPVAELIIVPAGQGIDSAVGWRSGPVRLRGSGKGLRPSTVLARAERKILRLAGRKARFDPSQGPIRLACLLLREGHGNLPRAPIGDVVCEVYGLGRDCAPSPAGRYRNEWRIVVRHVRGARRQITAAGREVPQ